MLQEHMLRTEGSNKGVLQQLVVKALIRPHAMQWNATDSVEGRNASDVAKRG